MSHNTWNVFKNKIKDMNADEKKEYLRQLNADLMYSKTRRFQNPNVMAVKMLKRQIAHLKTSIHGVSAIIGVILLAAIVVTMGATVWVYVTDYLQENYEIPIRECHSGIIQDKFRDTSNVFNLYFFVINNHDFYVNETTFYNYNIGDDYVCGV